MQDQSGQKRIVDDFTVDQVVAAFQAVRLTPKASDMLRLLATAENRVASRLELAKAGGSTSENSCNTVLGKFAHELADALDPAVAAEWAPHIGKGRWWVQFICGGTDNLTGVSDDEPDDWVFVMYERLAEALDKVGFAPYTEVDPSIFDPNGDVIGWSDDPLADWIDAMEELEDAPEEDAYDLRLARVGQGRFRDALLDRWDAKCAVTSCAVVGALAAVHAKPWRDCTHAERLNPANGVLLLANIAALSQHGFVTFDDEGRIQVSPEIETGDYAVLAINDSMRLRDVPADLLPFLAHHRHEVFLVAGEDEIEKD